MIDVKTIEVAEAIEIDEMIEAVEVTGIDATMESHDQEIKWIVVGIRGVERS